METLVNVVVSESTLKELMAGRAVAYRDGVLTLDMTNKKVMYCPKLSTNKAPYTNVQPSLRNSIDTLSLSVEDTEHCIDNCLGDNTSIFVKYTSSGIGGKTIAEQVNNGTARCTDVWCKPKETSINSNKYDYRNYDWFFKDSSKNSNGYEVSMSVIKEAVKFTF